MKSAYYRYLFFYCCLSSFCLWAKAEVSVEKKKDLPVSIQNKVKDQRYEYLKAFSDVLYHVEKSYVQPVSAQQLIKAAMRGIIQELDPHSGILDDQDLNHFKDQTIGLFTGIGIELAAKQGQWIVLSTLPDSPAQKAGIAPGDFILEINKQKTHNLNQDEVSRLLEIKRNKKFYIVFQKSDQKDLVQQVTLKPQTVSIPSVFHKLVDEEKVLYIRIKAFTEKTLTELRKALDQHQFFNALGVSSTGSSKNTKSLIVDLRENPGGLLDSAVKTADLFIKEGVIVHIKGRGEEHSQKIKAHSLDTLPFFPMVILLDSTSASAAEVFAGALKDHNRAVLIGETSFGKGSVQALFPLEKGAIKLTVAHYHTPAGLSIHGKGIAPHILSVKKSKSETIKWITAKDLAFQKALMALKTLRLFHSSSDF